MALGLTFARLNSREPIKGGRINPFANDIKAQRVEAAKKLATRFSELEWKYLCSYQWFLTGVSDGFDRGDFRPLQTKAEKALVDGKIRKRPLVLTIDTLTPAPWFGFL